MALAVVALGAGVLYVAVGGLRTVAGGLGSTLTGFVHDVTATPTPAPTVLTVSDTPLLEAPAEPYTSSSKIDLVVTVPAAMVGSTDSRIRVYLQLKDQPQTLVSEVPIAETGAKNIIPMELEKGINDFLVSIIGPGGESDYSPIVRYVLDTSKPKITVTSPKDNAKVNRKSVEIKGKVQGRSTLIARNSDNDSSITATAEGDGTFTLKMGLKTGLNHITITATDPAGNVAEKAITIRRGTGKLSASISASDYRISRKSLPEGIRLVCSVTDPDGAALKGADVTITLSVPGISTITSDGTTNGNGRYAFETTIPKGGVDPGQGNATCLVTASGLGSTQDFTAITITK
jgi:Glucodextranase, domain B